MKIKGIIFDMDGTLTVPVINFKDLRKELGITEEQDILTLAGTADKEKQNKYYKAIERYEKNALKKLRFQDNAEAVLKLFASEKLKLGIITRNSEENSRIVLDKLGVEFNPVLTREFGFVKPDPKPIEYILKKWQLDLEEVIIVGDYKDDVLCGKNAGIFTCFFENPGKESYGHLADIAVNSFAELKNKILKFN